jgi:hypothetical protein
MTKRIITLALLTTAMSYATTSIDSTINKMKTHEKICHTEACMSTPKLQEEVEKLSIEGKLPFEMGLELMKRWSNKKVS